MGLSVDRIAAKDLACLRIVFGRAYSQESGIWIGALGPNPKGFIPGGICLLSAKSITKVL